MKYDDNSNHPIGVKSFPREISRVISILKKENKIIWVHTIQVGEQ